MGRILIRGEAGHDIIPELYPLDSEIVIDKRARARSNATELGDVLENTHREFAGVRRHTEVCVTPRCARQRPRLSLVVLADGCASYFPEFHEMGLKDDQGQGGFRLGVQLSRGTGGTFTGVSTSAIAGHHDEHKRDDCGKSEFKPVLWTPGDWNAFFGSAQHPRQLLV